MNLPHHPARLVAAAALALLITTVPASAQRAGSRAGGGGGGPVAGHAVPRGSVRPGYPAPHTGGAYYRPYYPYRPYYYYGYPYYRRPGFGIWFGF